MAGGTEKMAQGLKSWLSLLRIQVEVPAPTAACQNPILIACTPDLCMEDRRAFRQMLTHVENLKLYREKRWLPLRAELVMDSIMSSS